MILFPRLVRITTKTGRPFFYRDIWNDPASIRQQSVIRLSQVAHLIAFVFLPKTPSLSLSLHPTLALEFETKSFGWLGGLLFILCLSAFD